MRDSNIYLEHILEAINKIELAKENYNSLGEFLSEDKWIYREVTFRQLEIIGEATKNLPKELTNQHKEIPWNQIKGMRNYLIHEYFSINYARVYETVLNDIPQLKSKIQDLLNSK